MIALVDADILTYRIGFACQSETKETYVANTVRSFLSDILFDLDDVEDFECFLTGKGNFRNDYAVTAPYKGNRKSEKPKWYNFIRELLLEEYEADLAMGEEADDTISIRATELKKENCIICSLDKDFDQVEGWHYNFVKKDLYYVEADKGLLNFYVQFLEGDRIDNIIGATGIGKVKATKLLTDQTEKKMFAICAEILGYDRALENGRLLYLRRKQDEVWNAPKGWDSL
jgi:hypothetical protein